MTNLPDCRYRRYTRRPGFLRLHCFLKYRDCTFEECQNCTFATPETCQFQEVEIDGIVMQGYIQRTPDLNRLAIGVNHSGPWVIDHSKDTRSDLQAIRVSLPRQRGKYRKFTIDSVGVITYAQEEGDWEPPKDINGYLRDPENPWRFIPLWPECLKRMPKAIRTKTCGCLQLTMVCDNLASELYTKIVTDAECQQCPVRVWESKQ